MLQEDFERELDRCRALIDAQLGLYFKEGGVLAEAMRYSLLAGGKRIRPIIVLQFCMAAGGDMSTALPAACAVEMLHTYSLIHDDLPCMDNDTMRRGKPTNHVVYGETMATLAGDALQAEAFGTLLKSELSAEAVVKMGQALARAAGYGGICLGQTLDMLSEGKELTLDQMSDVHHFKTASLLVAAAQIGVLSAGGNIHMLRAASMYAAALGLAFQIRDDILDFTSSTEVLGKPAGSDAVNQKTTFVTLFGLDDCERLVREKTQEAISALGGHFANTEFLEALAINLEERKY